MATGIIMTQYLWGVERDYPMKQGEMIKLTKEEVIEFTERNDTEFDSADDLYIVTDRKVDDDGCCWMGYITSGVNIEVRMGLVDPSDMHAIGRG